MKNRGIYGSIFSRQLIWFQSLGLEILAGDEFENIKLDIKYGPRKKYKLDKNLYLK